MNLSRPTFIALLLSCQLFASAAWLTNEPQTITQPDGAVINCFATGDEFYNWLHDANGFTIIQNHETGFYTYAILENDVLKPSQYIVGQAEPNLMITPIRKVFCRTANLPEWIFLISVSLVKPSLLK